MIQVTPTIQQNLVLVLIVIAFTTKEHEQISKKIQRSKLSQHNLIESILEFVRESDIFCDSYIY